MLLTIKEISAYHQAAVVREYYSNSACFSHCSTVLLFPIQHRRGALQAASHHFKDVRGHRITQFCLQTNSHVVLWLHTTVWPRNWTSVRIWSKELDSFFLSGYVQAPMHATVCLPLLFVCTTACQESRIGGGQLTAVSLRSKIGILNHGWNSVLESWLEVKPCHLKQKSTYSWFWTWLASHSYRVEGNTMCLNAKELWASSGVWHQEKIKFFNKSW